MCFKFQFLSLHSLLYTKLLKSKNNNALFLKQTKKILNKQNQIYLETDIYNASKEIKKMQKLENRILLTQLKFKKL